jgi:hypothetical protein
VKVFQVSKEQVKPWISMWIKPRQALRAIVTENLNRSFFVLSTLYGWVGAFQIGQGVEALQAMPTLAIFLITLCVAPFIGAAFFTIASGAFWLTGKLLRGKATFKSLLLAVSWSHITSVVILSTWLILLFFFRDVIFCAKCVAITQGTPRLFALIALSFVQNFFGVWTIVLLVAALAEVQRFSIGKGVLNLVLPFVFILGIIWGLAGLVHCLG